MRLISALSLLLLVVLLLVLGHAAAALGDLALRAAEGPLVAFPLEARRGGARGGRRRRGGALAGFGFAAHRRQGVLVSETAADPGVVDVDEAVGVLADQRLAGVDESV